MAEEPDAEVVSVDTLTMQGEPRSIGRWSAAVVSSALLFLCACSFSPDVPDLQGLYNREASYHGPDRNPIIVLPGILGSRLFNPDGGEIVWGAFTGHFADPATPEGARLAALPFREGAPLREITDGIEPAGVLDSLKISLLGVPISAKAYRNILGTLGVGGYRDEELGMAAIDYGDDHFTCFQFPYDWRRDNVENARLLKAFILEKKTYVEAELKRRYGVEKDVKFDIVAHSMGGLVTRYFLRHGDQDLPADGSDPELNWDGARYVERVVLVATPNSGSAEAIVQLVQGITFAPFLPQYGPGVLGSMPAIYQLLPRSRHKPLLDAADSANAPGDVFDPALWERLGWGLAAPDVDRELAYLMPDVPDAASRSRIAREHQRKCLERARRFTELLDRPAQLPEGLDLALFAGDAVETKSAVYVDTATGALERFDHGPGDGTVLRTSALLDERVGGEWGPRLVTPIDWSAVTFVFADHIGLTKSAVFTDNVLYYLLEAPQPQARG